MYFLERFNNFQSIIFDHFTIQQDSCHEVELHLIDGP